MFHKEGPSTAKALLSFCFLVGCMTKKKSYNLIHWIIGSGVIFLWNLLSWLGFSNICKNLSIQMSLLEQCWKPWLIFHLVKMTVRKETGLSLLLICTIVLCYSVSKAHQLRPYTNGLLYLNSIHHLWKIWGMCTMGESEFSNAPTFWVIFRLVSHRGVNILLTCAKWAYLLSIYTPPC